MTYAAIGRSSGRRLTSREAGAEGAALNVLPLTSTHQFVTWLTLIGLVIPAWEAEASIAGAKFTAGRLAVTLLAVPAAVVLARRGGRLVAGDVFVLLATIWMLAAAATTGGSLASPMAESLQLLFGYMAGRAFYRQPSALEAFVRTLAGLTFVMVAIAAGEALTGRWLAHDAAAAIFGTMPLPPGYRNGVIRATSTLDHPILFGVFCALVNSILLLWTRGVGRRVLFSAICLAGCVLSQSAAALMAYALGFAAFAYDRLMQAAPQRWTLFWLAVGGASILVVLVSRHPVSWLISHLTLDPESSYYRLLIWSAALERIGQSPLTGYSFNPFPEYILNATVDSVWLVESLRYGIPAAVFLFLANVAACWPVRPTLPRADDEYDHRMSLAFTIVLLLLVFSGFTVHFWNYMWIFWGVCIGIKCSLKERALIHSSRRVISRGQLDAAWPGVT